jgi:hypothetical protein
MMASGQTYSSSAKREKQRSLGGKLGHGISELCLERSPSRDDAESHGKSTWYVQLEILACTHYMYEL